VKPDLNVGRSGKNLMPSKADQRAYLKKIREAADRGEVIAMAALLMLSRLDDMDRQHKEIAQSYNLDLLKLLGLTRNGHAGLVGDENDPKEKILAAIREHDPQSKQLPENKN